MPQTSLSALLGRLHPASSHRPTSISSSPIDDIDRVAEDQQAAREQVRGALVLRSQFDRAVILGTLRHELRLPLGSHHVPLGALHLARADDSSITLGSNARAGTRFRADVVVVDGLEGSVAHFAVDSWHERDGKICGLRQLLHVRRTVIRAVRSVDFEAEVTDLEARSRE